MHCELFRSPAFPAWPPLCPTTHDNLDLYIVLGFPGGSNGKESACSAQDPGSIPGLGRSPGEGNGNPLQYSCLENSWTEEPGGLQFIGLQKAGHDWVTNIFTSFILCGIPLTYILGRKKKWLCDDFSDTCFETSIKDIVTLIMTFKIWFLKRISLRDLREKSISLKAMEVFLLWIYLYLYTCTYICFYLYLYLDIQIETYRFHYLLNFI